MLKCKVCGTANSPDSSVCANCGEKLRVNRKSSTGKRKKVKRDPQRRKSSEPKDIFSTSDYQQKENSSESVIKDVFSSEEAYEKVRKGTVLEKIHVLEEEIGDTAQVIDDEPEEQKIIPTVINRSTSNDLIRSFDSPKGSKSGKEKKHDIPHRVIHSVRNPVSGKKFENKTEENTDEKEAALQKTTSVKKKAASASSEDIVEKKTAASSDSGNAGAKKRRPNKKKFRERRPQTEKTEIRKLSENNDISKEETAEPDQTEAEAAMENISHEIVPDEISANSGNSEDNTEISVFEDITSYSDAPKENDPFDTQTPVDDEAAEAESAILDAELLGAAETAEELTHSSEALVNSDESEAAEDIAEEENASEINNVVKDIVPEEIPSEEAENADPGIDVIEVGETELDEIEHDEAGLDVIALDSNELGQIAADNEAHDETEDNELVQEEAEQEISGSEESDPEEDEFFSVDNEEDEAEDYSPYTPDITEDNAEEILPIEETEPEKEESSAEVSGNSSDIISEVEIASDIAGIAENTDIAEIAENTENTGSAEQDDIQDQSSSENESAPKKKKQRDSKASQNSDKPKKKKRKKPSGEPAEEEPVKKRASIKSGKKKSDDKKEEPVIKSREVSSTKEEEKTPAKAKKTASASSFSPEDIEENRYVAALSYLGILLILPLFKVKESEFCRAHVKQGVRVLIYSLIVLIATLAAVLGLRVLVLWVLGLNVIIYKVLAFAIAAVMAVLIFIPSFNGALSAFSGTYKKVPFVGKDQ